MKNKEKLNKSGGLSIIPIILYSYCLSEKLDDKINNKILTTRMEKY
jgi:hypothetical protein